MAARQTCKTFKLGSQVVAERNGERCPGTIAEIRGKLGKNAAYLIAWEDGEPSTLCRTEQLEFPVVKVNWAQCQQCEQWRVTDRRYADGEEFLCSHIYPWTDSQEGGCKTDPDSYSAFDTGLVRDRKVSIDSVRECIVNLLDKLARTSIDRSLRSTFASQARKCATAPELWEMVRAFKRSDCSLNSSQYAAAGGPNPRQAATILVQGYVCHFWYSMDVFILKMKLTMTSPIE